jgi:predicted dehydrogenase/threonine dehydrogenase-like Zn-dependent dehydrogenase
MKQVLQSLGTGVTDVHEVPAPEAGNGEILIRTQASLVSTGTERMLLEFGKAGWLGKARRQPDKVRMVLEKVSTDGLMPTMEAVFAKLDKPMPLGYCNVGVVMEVGRDVTGFAVGGRVASNGQHAEVVAVPANLCAKVPEAVSDDEAAFAVTAAVALQGIRLLQPTLGESVVVTGLGLIGLVAVQLLRANGCRVLGIDFDPGRLALARQFGAETVDLAAGQDPVAAAVAFSRGRGVDGVLIAASTDSSEPVHQAAQMCRKRGRIVLVGVTGLELSRADFYEKELTFQVSCSYGPGRYDPAYEEKGQDYPVGYVRWSAQRNFEAVLDMMADGRLDLRPLISHRFKIGEAAKAYELIAGDQPSLGVLLQYPTAEEKPDDELRNSTVKLAAPLASTGKAVLGFVGSGNYATSVLIPAFKASGTRLKSVASSGGVSGLHAGQKFGFESTTTDARAIFGDAEINAVAIATRHDSHATLVCEALGAGKHVFVEKPLALSAKELDEIATAAAGKQTLLMVGFNRRFAPHVRKMKSLLEPIGAPKTFVMTVNAGSIPPDHWTQDPQSGGGRILGEACHFIDLLRFLAGAPITGHTSTRMAGQTGDTATIQLSFQDGSIGTIHYFANGSRRFPKERLEVFAAGGVLQLDNFRKLKGYGWPGFSSMNLWRQDKGQRACAAAFIDAIENGKPSPIPFEELMEVSRVTIEVAEALR